MSGIWNPPVATAISPIESANGTAPLECMWVKASYRQVRGVSILEGNQGDEARTQIDSLGGM